LEFAYSIIKVTRIEAAPDRLLSRRFLFVIAIFCEELGGFVNCHPLAVHLDRHAEAAHAQQRLVQLRQPVFFGQRGGKLLAGRLLAAVGGAPGTLGAGGQLPGVLVAGEQFGAGTASVPRMDLQSEHERYLVEKHFKKPVILTNYPKDIKAFYMKMNDDGKTVRAMDVLFPKIGEIIGGSQREENLDKLLKRIAEMGIPEKDVWWYLDTRRFGTAPHSGFGLGFERLILFVTGMSNIRDVIPFPRTPMNAEF